MLGSFLKFDFLFLFISIFFPKGKLELHDWLNSLTIGDLMVGFSPTINAMTICPSKSVINVV